ncbi:MAG: hypothetical protein PHO37_10090 [Kiritimatiellae bacterium]|nr:hypothetical protein [Kiritimatiellia bacterium]
MKTEIQVALIGIGAAIIGGLCSSFVSIWLNQKQLSFSYDRLRLEILEKRMNKLEATWKIINETSADLRDPNLSSVQIRSRCADMFIAQAGAFLSIAHYFPQELNDDLTKSRQEINKLVLEAKTGMPPADLETYQRVFGSIQPLQKRMFEAMSNELSTINKEIVSLTILKNKE